MGRVFPKSGRSFAWGRKHGFLTKAPPCTPKETKGHYG